MTATETTSYFVKYLSLSFLKYLHTTKSHKSVFELYIEREIEKMSQILGHKMQIFIENYTNRKEYIIYEH
jgi:hypothetical protein